MMLAGAAIRQFFVLRHGYKLGRNRHPWPYAAVGGLVLLGLILALRPAPVAPASAAAAVQEPIDIAAVQTVMAERCISCHGASMQMKNVRLDSPALLNQHAQAIYQQVVVSRAMPMNNATGMTEAERLLIQQWFSQRAQP
jgi:uncharacterized membrane protein